LGRCWGGGKNHAGGESRRLSFTKKENKHQKAKLTKGGGGAPAKRIRTGKTKRGVRES